jgi:16S rRNA (guanine966-N2)-methyltransferase
MLKDKTEIFNKDYLELLNLLQGKEKFDIIFLDPPYKSDFIVKSIDKIIELNLLSENGIIIAETNDKNKEKEILKNSNIEIYDKRKYGIAVIIFIRKG